MLECLSLHSSGELHFPHMHVPTYNKPFLRVTLCLSPLGPGTWLVCMCTYIYQYKPRLPGQSILLFKR